MMKDKWLDRMEGEKWLKRHTMESNLLGGRSQHTQVIYIQDKGIGSLVQLGESKSLDGVLIYAFPGIQHQVNE